MCGVKEGAWCVLARLGGRQAVRAQHEGRSMGLLPRRPPAALHAWITTPHAADAFPWGERKQAIQAAGCSSPS